jgi:hypothetical protein
MGGTAEVRWRAACLALAAALVVAASLAPSGTGALRGQAFSRSAATHIGMPAPCPVTTPELAPVPTPSSPEAYTYDPSGVSAWYVSPDRTLWVGADVGWRRGGNKVGWLRPPGSTLTVTGRRLDGEAPPLGVDLPDGYPWNFQVSGLDFPTGGCWEITGEAAGSTLRFVVAVDPGHDPPTPVGTTLAGGAAVDRASSAN